VITDDICKRIRKTGGENEDGLVIPFMVERRLKLVCYFIRFHHKTSSAADIAVSTLNNIRPMIKLKEWEDNHEKADMPPKMMESKDWKRNLDTFEEFLRENLGVTKIPLAYVIRANIEPADDPVPPETWPKLQEERIARAPIRVGNVYVATFQTDNTRVWALQAACTRGKPCWTYISVYQCRRDGRAAFRTLHDHYFGENEVDNLATEAENKLMTLKYYGEKRNWDFE